MIHMTQETQAALSDEDQMSQALADIRSERADVPAPADATPQPDIQPAAVEPASTPAQAVAEQQPAQDAPAATDPQETLKAVQAELHKARSEMGRVGALNTKYLQATQEAAQLREKLAQLQSAQSQAPQSVSDAQTRLAQVADQVKDFPELAGIVSAISDVLQQTDKKTEEVARRVAAQVVEPLEPLRREQDSRIQTQRQAAYDAAFDTFNTTYPRAVEVIKSEDFNVWLHMQPGPVQYAFAKGQSPQDAMLVLDSYDMHLRRQGKPPIAQIGAPTPPTQQPDQGKSASNVQRLARAAGIPSRASGATGSLPPADDFDAALAHFRAKRLGAARAAA